MKDIYLISISCSADLQIYDWLGSSAFIDSSLINYGDLWWANEWWPQNLL